MNSRGYIQRRRAESAAATGTNILRAAAELFVEAGEEPTLDAVASRAGVTVQTVLRRFGSKEGLARAAVADASQRVSDARGAAPVGDVEGAIANLVEHYVEWGSIALRLLALEGGGTALAGAAAEGRAFHHAWVERVFAPLLVAMPDAPRRLVQLIAVTDVYVWKLLHHDLGLSREDAEAAIVDLVRRVLT